MKIMVVLISWLILVAPSLGSFSDLNVAALGNFAKGIWPPPEIEGKEPLTVIWSPSLNFTEHDWVHDWLLAKVRRPVITIPDPMCPPAVAFGIVPDPRGGVTRTEPKEVLWVIYGSGTSSVLACFAKIIVTLSREQNVRFGLLHLSDEFVAAPVKCSDSSRDSWCGSALVDLYQLPAVKYVFRNHWALHLMSDGTPGQVWKNKIRWLPLGVTQGFGRPRDNSLLVASKRKWRCMFSGSAGPLPMSPRQRFLEKLPGYNLEERYGCKIAVGNTWGGGYNKQEYRHLLQESAIVLCPGGNYAMETFRIWESLAAGAIPIIEKGTGVDWHPLPVGHPLILIDDWDKIHDVLASLDTPAKLDAKQRQTMVWWNQYIGQLQSTIADVIG